MSTFLKRKFTLAALAVAATLAATGAAQAALLFNQNVSPGIIMGSHNATTGAADTRVSRACRRRRPCR